MKVNTCCFFGHRKIEDTLELRARLFEVVEKLIADENVDTFLFGSKSEFNTLCYEIVTKIKEKYPHIKRVYVRAEYPYIDDNYKTFLLENYEDTYYPEKVVGAGKAVYVERNCEMINNSSVCIIYFDEKTIPTTRKSGTKLALDYALNKGKRIINLKWISTTFDVLIFFNDCYSNIFLYGEK